MPGAYATVMQNAVVAGRYPQWMLNAMLYRNLLQANHDMGADGLNDFVIGPNLASCHPTAIKFTNVVSPGTFAGDDVFGLGDGLFGAAAVPQVTAAQLALAQNERIIWIRYGGLAGHSFMLLTGQADPLESFEAWAGGAGGYPFDTSVYAEADLVGTPRRPRNTLTRAVAIAALTDLLDANHLVRGAAADLLSRAGAAGFGGYWAGGPVPGLNIHVAVTQGIAAFTIEIANRMRDSGWYCALAAEAQQAGSRVCSRCQQRAATVALARTGRWRSCATCQRRYCRQCKRVLASRPRISNLIQTRVRICDCGANTARI